MIFLVLNKDVKLSYKDQYKVFSTPEKAVAYAKSIGYEDPSI